MATAASSAGAARKGPFRLVTVNPQPERAKRIVSQVIVRLQGTYAIEHVANIDGELGCVLRMLAFVLCSALTIMAAEDKVATTVTSLQPDILFCASSWSPDESERIVARAQAARPGLRTYAVPHGLHGAGGPEAVAAHLAEQVGKEHWRHDYMVEKNE